MRSPLLILLATSALAFTAACGASEEEAPGATATLAGQTAISTTPGTTPDPTIPADLPTAADGYEWFVGPASGFGLPTYDVQIPVDWNSVYPGDSNPRWFAPASDKGAGLFDPHVIIMVTPPGPWTEKVFAFELPWQGGGLCGVLPDGGIEAAAGKWTLYKFTCPRQETGICSASADGTTISCLAADQGPPPETVSGRAAELQFDGHFYSVLVFDPDGAPSAGAAFEKSISTLVPRWR